MEGLKQPTLADLNNKAKRPATNNKLISLLCSYLPGTKRF